MSIELATTLQEGKPFLVGEWLVEPTLNRLTRGEVTVQLESKAIDVLLCLVAHASEVVGRETLFDTVWQTEFVSDSTITSRIGELRSAFGDDAQNPRYIETIRKRGYRLIAEVRPVSIPVEGSASAPETAPAVDDERNPYPGLAAFTEADADRFFGREAEAAALWKKITARRLLAVIGPSGVGKSSLLRAGVAARTPPGWRVVVFTPGDAPTLSLARALAPDHAGDPAAMARLLGFSDSDTALAVVSRWRGQFREVVLVVDQFEELFTLNPPEVQASFIGLLRRLVDAADVHLVLAMRDDYLYRCQQHEEIAPIFKDLTPLPPPTAEGLRRALKEPAGRQLYRFETELLVDRMIAEVDGERGALPLLAFAVHRLWEERDRDERLLTGEAYERIGGVAGALARHADATLERIGPERLPIVRELFRNLVTAEGTRAVREVDELLSVFGNTQQSSSSPRASKDPSTRPSDGLAQDDRRSAAEEVLSELVDARLLTGYRDQHDGDRPMRRVEIVHESLLTTWPRLVRWQTQDADGARLRDDLRQAARLWDDHARARDYLWSGTALREFAVWRENYPGGLTALEEDFASAMTSLATRRRRRRRIAVAAIIAVLLAVLAVVGTLWRRSVQETRHAEAAKLLALGQLRLEDYPTATLAHAIASLELADTPEARRLALRALWEGPTAFVINTDPSHKVACAPDGEWLVQSIQDPERDQLVLVRQDGSSYRFDEIFGSDRVFTVMSPDGRVLFSEPELPSGSPQRVVLWSLPDRRKLADVHIAPQALVNARVIGWNRSRCLVLVWEDGRATVHGFGFDRTHQRLGTLEVGVQEAGWSHRVGTDLRTGRWFAFVEGGKVWAHAVDETGLSTPGFVGSHEGAGHRLAVEPEGRLIATSSDDGLIKIWDPTGTSPPVVLRGPAGIDRLGFAGPRPHIAARAETEDGDEIWVFSVTEENPHLVRTLNVGPRELTRWRPLWGWDLLGRYFAYDAPDGRTRLWSLPAPADAEPLVLRRGDVGTNWDHSFRLDGSWLATADTSGLMLWPLTRAYPYVLKTHSKPVERVQFGPGGRWLASGCQDGIVRITPLAGDVPAPSRVVTRRSTGIRTIAASPNGKLLLVGGDSIGAAIVPLDGGASLRLGSFAHALGVAFSPDGRFAAVAGASNDWRMSLEVWQVDTLERTLVVDIEGATTLGAPQFADDQHVLVNSGNKLQMVDLQTGDTRQVFEGVPSREISVSADGSRIALVHRSEFGFGASGRALMIDLDTGSQRYLDSHGDRVWTIGMNAEGTIVATGDRDGVLRVGFASGEEPHLLLGHDGRIWSVDIDTSGRWIATGGADATVRIWPMADLTKPPLHTLPHDELIAKLKSLTNVRVVRDDKSASGWTISHEPFPGWETVPTW